SPERRLSMRSAPNVVMLLTVLLSASPAWAQEFRPLAGAREGDWAALIDESGPLKERAVTLMVVTSVTATDVTIVTSRIGDEPTWAEQEQARTIPIKDPSLADLLGLP